MMRGLLLLVALVLAWRGASAAAAGGAAAGDDLSPHVRVRAVGLRDARWTRGFWAEKFDLCRRVMLPEVQKALENPANAAVLQNFAVAAGLKEGKHLGANWSDGDCYKYLEAVARVYAVTGEADLDRLMDEWIAVVARAQAADGYLSTNIQLTDKGRLQDPHHHEMYNMGHLLTAASVHHRVTGKENFLAVARRLGDFLYRTFQPRPPELAHFGWNPSNIMGLVDLYRATRDPRYLELAGIFVDMRGSAPGGSDLTQDRVPLRQETEAVGHAVCACYLWSGAADVCAETGEAALRGALERIWTSACTRRMYITGAVGSFWHGQSTRGDKVHEAFGADYELPSRTAYNETCSNIANAMWNRRMLALTADARYADVVERVLHNSLLSAVGADGRGFFYANPLARDGRPDGLSPHHTPQRWSIHRCFCCPPQVIRTIAQLHEWAYGRSGDAVWVHLYGASTLKTTLPDGARVALTQETEYPWDGRVRIAIGEAPGREVALMLRVPGWAEAASIRINGRPFDGTAAPGTYAALHRRWAAGDVVDLDLPMPVRLMEAHPAAEALRGQVAVVRGPVVYCLESPDLPEGVGVESVAIPAGIQLAPRLEKDLLGGVVVLSGTALKREPGAAAPSPARSEEWGDALYRPLDVRQAAPPAGPTVPITLIPYYAWANRGASHMTVWMPVATADPKGSPDRAGAERPPAPSG